MVTKEGISELRTRLNCARQQAEEYFAESLKQQEAAGRHNGSFEDGLSAETRTQGLRLSGEVKLLSVEIAGAARGSALIAEADLHDLRHNVRRMLASFRFHEYRFGGVYIHHDEDTVLGIDPPWQNEEPLHDVAKAHELFKIAAVRVIDLIDLISPANSLSSSGPSGTASYRPNSAFIIMAIDKNKPDLEDLKEAIKAVCKEFDIEAVRADEIEHEEAITERVLQEIETSEFLIADVTGERPNVYYEIGYAHARNKRVIMYRRDGEKLHFDIAHRNCPSYSNLTNLKDLLRKRLESVTNKPMKT